MADVTGRTILVLALAATGSLVVGARLLEAPTPGSLPFALLALVVGTALAAAAVAGAWRPVPRESSSSDPDSLEPATLDADTIDGRVSAGAGARGRRPGQPSR